MDEKAVMFTKLQWQINQLLLPRNLQMILSWKL